MEFDLLQLLALAMGHMTLLGAGKPPAVGGGGGPTNGIQLETADFLLVEDGNFLVME